MDLLGYAALGGLERLTIVAGAVIIGYWGYRLYTAEKNAGLIFMVLAVVVLVGALATGGSYLRSVGEGYQLASLPGEATTEDSPFVEAPVPVATPAAPEAPAAARPAETPQAASAATETPAEPSAELAADVAEPPAPAVPADAADAPTATAAEPAAAEPAESPVRLATGAELGGRIVSVKSENVSLEWSADSDESGSGPE